MANIIENSNQQMVVLSIESKLLQQKIILISLFMLCFILQKVLNFTLQFLLNFILTFTPKKY